MTSLLDVCWMAVEPRYAADVEALLLSLRARDGDLGTDLEDDEPRRTVGARRRTNGGGSVWDEEDYDAFIAADQESYRRVRALAAVLADSPGDEFPMAAVAQAAGLTASQVRAALGKFTRWMTARTDNTEWPFGWVYGGDVDSDNPSAFRYTMTREQAAAWTAAVHRATGHSA